MSHDQPSYASVPGIRVYGMMCVRSPGSSVRRPGGPGGSPIRVGSYQQQAPQSVQGLGKY